MDHKSIYKRFCTALEKIGINNDDRKLRNISFHSYRHGVNTNLLQANIPPETVRLISGHSGTQMTAHYAHLQLPNISKIQSEGNRSNDSKNNHLIVPAYIESLVNKSFLFPDGKRVVKSLDTVAFKMQTLNIKPTEKLLMELFVKPSGEKYSLKACKKALNYSNTK
jgi:hypothetical protein